MHKQMMQSGAAGAFPRSSNTMRKWPLDTRESAGDQGCARTAFRVVQRRTEKVRGQAKDRPHGRDVTGAGVRPRSYH